MDPSTPPAAHFGRFELVAEAHVGSTTAVFQVRDPVCSRVLALKTCSSRATPERRPLAQRFLERESEIRAVLDHPAILPLYEKVTLEDGIGLIGPWLSKGTLMERWKARPHPRTVLAIAEQLCGALDVLHQQGWVHGDLSPVNIMFGTDDRARIIDFGSCVPAGSIRALAIDPDDPGYPARWGVTRLTSAPECWTGQPVDGRTDLYALGVMLYFLLVGSWPFSASDKEALTRLHLEQPAPLPSSRCLEWGSAVDEVLLRALAKNPAHRYASGAALFSALSAAIAADQGDLDIGQTSGRPSFDGFPALVSPAFETEGAGASTRAQHVVDDFLAELPPAERREFAAALQALRRKDAAHRADAQWLLREKLVPIAALKALESLGILQALAVGPRSLDALAEQCGGQTDKLQRLCQFLASEHLLTQTDGQWQLNAPWSALYLPSLGPVGAPIRATDAHWARLVSWVKTGEAAVAMDRDESGGSYQAAVQGLAERSELQARSVAAALSQGALVPDRRAILDVGAGSGVWSLALAKDWPEATVTALDRPQVLEVTRARAREQGLTDRLHTLEGSWQTCALPGRTFGVIVVAKFCHLEASLSALFQHLAPALSDQGRLIIIDTIPDRLAEASADVLRYDLSLGLRTSTGRIHDREQYTQALASAGLEPAAFWNIRADKGRLDVLVARPKRSEVPAEVAGVKQATPPSTPSKPEARSHPTPPPVISARAKTPALDLPRLLAPCTEEILHDHMLRRAVLHIPATHPDRFTPYFGWEIFFGLLQRGAVPPEKVRITRGEKGVERAARKLFDDRGRFDVTTLHALQREGASIILNKFAAACPTLWALAVDAEQRLGDRVDVAAIASMSRMQALKAHYDTQDLLVLQVEGRKHWTFLGKPVDAPRQGNEDGVNVPEDVTGSITLQPGDVLFVPRGQHHVCQADDRSLHLGLLITRRTGDHFLQWLPQKLELEPFLASTLRLHKDPALQSQHEAQIKQALHRLIDQASLSEFLAEDDAQQLGSIDVALAPPERFSPDALVRRAVIRPIPVPDVSVEVLKWRGVELTLGPAVREILEQLNASVELPVHTLLERMSGTFSQQECEDALRRLAGAGLVILRGEERR